MDLSPPFLFTRKYYSIRIVHVQHFQLYTITSFEKFLSSSPAYAPSSELDPPRRLADAPRHPPPELPLLLTGIFVLVLPERDGHVLVLVHVHDLPLHRHEEQHAEVHEQYRPEDGHVEDREERHRQRREDPARARVPKFELRQPPRERAILLPLLGRGGQAEAVVAAPPHVRGIVERAQEGDEILQEEYAQTVSDDEVSLDQVDPQEEEGEDDGEEYPPRHDVDGRFVQPVLDGPSH